MSEEGWPLRFYRPLDAALDLWRSAHRIDAEGATRPGDPFSFNEAATAEIEGALYLAVSDANWGTSSARAHLGRVYLVRAGANPDVLWAIDDLITAHALGDPAGGAVSDAPAQVTNLPLPRRIFTVPTFTPTVADLHRLRDVLRAGFHEPEIRQMAATGTWPSDTQIARMAALRDQR